MRCEAPSHRTWRNLLTTLNPKDNIVHWHIPMWHRQLLQKIPYLYRWLNLNAQSRSDQSAHAQLQEHEPLLARRPVQIKHTNFGRGWREKGAHFIYHWFLHLLTWVSAPTVKRKRNDLPLFDGIGCSHKCLRPECLFIVPPSRLRPHNAALQILGKQIRTTSRPSSSYLMVYRTRELVMAVVYFI